MLTQLTIFLYIVIFLYGIVIGSFLNVCILRIPRKENIASHSHCMTCGRKLGWRYGSSIFLHISTRQMPAMWGEDIHTVPIDRGSEWCAVCDRFHGERIYFQQRSLLSHDICTRSNYGHR